MNIFVLLFVLLICIILISSIKNDTFNNVKTGGRGRSPDESYYDRSQVSPVTRESHEPVTILYADFPKSRMF